jgi:hypothetical protein
MAALALTAQIDDTRADYHRLAPAEREHVYYLKMPPGSKRDWPAVTAFAVTGASRALVLNSHLPVKVAEGYYRINLRELGWQKADFDKVLAKYPYQPSRVLRADWLVDELSDSQESDAYTILLFSGKGFPKTIAEWLAGLGIDRGKAQELKLLFGLVETKSGVARHLYRYMTFIPSLVGYDTETGDVAALNEQTSPLEHPNPKTFKADASEYIVGIPKVWYAARDGKRVGGRGALQVYTLANKEGVLQKVAPTSIVEDHTRFRGNAEIRYPGSCIACHRTGLNAPTRNGFKDLIDLGVELHAKDAQDRDEIERFHLTDEGQYIARANADYAGAVQAATGKTPQEITAEYIACIDEYRADLTLARAAAEVGATADELKLALAAQYPGAHLSELAHGKPIPRDVWESVAERARRYVQAIRN